MIGQETIDRVREQTNIVELVGGQVKLERRGRSYVGLCPFHQEKTPSFHVNDERGFYHCFGCQASGLPGKLLVAEANTGRPVRHKISTILHPDRTPRASLRATHLRMVRQAPTDSWRHQ